MADTAIAVTAGTGTNVDTRTEGTNGNHRQVVVIGDPATNAGVATVTDGAPAATDYALVVGIHPDSVNANGQNTAANSAPVVLSDYGKTVVKDVSLTLDTSAYAAGDVVAATQQVDAAMRVANGTGILQSAIVIDRDDQKKPMTFYVLSQNNGIGAENGAPAPSDTGAAAILGSFDVSGGDFKDLGGVSIATLTNLGIPVTAFSGTDDLYVAAVNGADTGIYSASGLVLRLGIQQD
jgi:hypothetical protein